MRAAAWLLPVLALAMGACGGMSESERFSLRTPGTDGTLVREIEGSEKPRIGAPTESEVATIRGWADALRAGHVTEAASFFALPAIVGDTSAPLRRLANRQAVVKFHRGLPCGGKLVGTRRGATSTVIATFQLTERPGAGSCGSGVGHRVDTAIVVERRHIVRMLSGVAPSQASGNG